MLSNASLRSVRYIIIEYKVRVKKISKNIEKKEIKIFIRVNKSIYSEIKIEKID